MIRNFWQLFKDTLIYGSGNALLIILAFFTIPIFTRVFAPADYGVIELVATIGGILTLFLSLGVGSAIQRDYFEAPDAKHKKKVVSTGLWFLVAWCTLLVGIMILCSRWISPLTFGTGNYVDVLIIAFISAASTLFLNLCKNILQVRFSPWKFSLIALLSGLLTLAFSLIFVLQLEMGILGYVAGGLAGTILSLIPALYFVRGDIAFTFSFSRIKQMLSFGAPLVPAGIAFLVLTMSDRFFLAKLATLDDVGLYSVALKVSSLMLLLLTAFGTAWSPLAYRLYCESGEMFKQVTSRVMIYILVIFSFLAVFLTTASFGILRLITVEEYFGADIAIGPLCLAALAYASTQVTALGISLQRKTKYIAIFAGMAAVVNLVLCFFLIPLWGISGAAAATAISYTLLTLSYYGISQKLYPINFDKLAILKICLICLLFVAAGRFIIFSNLILGIFAKLGFILLFVAVLFLAKVLQPQEVAYLKQWLVGLKKVRSIADLRTLVKSQLGG